MNGRKPRGTSRAGSDGEALFEDIPVGAVVTAVRPTQRDPLRCTIRVGKRVVATLERRKIDELGVRPGEEWTAELAARVFAAAAESRAIAEAMRRLTRRARSRGQIIDGLVRKGHDRAAAEAAADHLERIGLLDDRAYAEGAARELLARKPAGKRFVEAKLRERRVPREIASEVAGEAAESRDEAEDAVMLARKRAASMSKTLAPDVVRRRLYGYLARRGFDGDACRRAVEEAVRGMGGEEGE